ncbi:kinase-like domain-containing protein [Xylaria cf. heliscus]|nr:kinase-like domain-containing protein [Xylaria cf. heliscus]
MAHVPDADEVSPGWSKEPPNITTQGDGSICITQYGISFPKERSRPQFYPPKLLNHCFTREVLAREIDLLGPLQDADKKALVEQVLGSGNPATEGYIQVFAILKLIYQPNKLLAFVLAGVNDQELPLRCDEQQPGYQLFYGKSKTPFPDHILNESGRSTFYREQYHVVLPFFDIQPGIYNLDWTHMLPYYEIDRSKKAKEPSDRTGSSGEVSKILIHPHCHNFSTVFEYLNLADEDMFFALKTLNKNNPNAFQREVEMLQRFNRTKHPHIVTLLAAFSRCNKNYLIFPWASYDLSMYWEKVNPTPDAGDIELVRWISRQACQLVEAVSLIHDLPENQEEEEESRLYGRHGDLKPENIIWYKSRDGLGKLVITDMGLSKTHRFKTRTYSSPQTAPATPKYRPPELDYEHGLMGRKFDIWTLGCVFFELLCWLYGGYKDLVEMENKMETVYILGVFKSMYYEWVYVKDNNFCTIRVNPAVTEKIQALRQECSQFVFDFLDIIQMKMLIVDLSDRASAENLSKEIKKLDSRCHDKDSYVQNESRERLDPPKPKLQKRVPKKVQSEQWKEALPRVTSTDFG